VLLGAFACLCTLKQSCSKFYREQKLFYDLGLAMSRTCSKLACQSVLGAVLGSADLAKCGSLTKLNVSFNVGYFGDLQFANQAEPGQTHIRKVGVLV
jgi:hypothetical protein